MTADPTEPILAAVGHEPWGLLDELPTGLVLADDAGTVTWCNRSAGDLLDARPSELLGRLLAELAALADARDCTCEEVPGRSGAVVIRPLREAESEKLELLARVSEELAGSLNLDRTLARIVHLVVPRLADGCLLSFIDGGHLLRVGAVSRGGRAVHWLEEGLRPRDSVGAALRARATETSEVRSDLGPDDVADYVPAGPLWEPLQTLAPQSAAVVPLRGRGASIGALVLLRGEGLPPFDPRDLAAVEGLAHRAAVAIDNALIYQDRSTVARVLQASLLPDALPDVPALDLGVRYRPLTTGSDIGGDFYDVFAVGEGSWAVVVGDVCGKGIEAATLTGLARHTIRAVAQHLADPAEVLRALNEAVRQQRRSTFCTVAMARAVPTPTGVDFTVAAGGHPAAQVLHADGTVTALPASGTLLGMLPTVRFRTADISLRPGDALVLYTDGIVEARAGHREFGEAGLQRSLATSAGLDADAIADRLVQDVTDFAGGKQNDDIAVVVARVQPSR